MCGSVFSKSRQYEVTFPWNIQLNFLVIIDWFLLILLTFHGELGNGYYPLKNFLIKTVLMKDFPLTILDWQDFNLIEDSSSNETKSQESYFSNQDILTSLKEIQQ